MHAQTIARKQKTKYNETTKQGKKFTCGLPVSELYGTNLLFGKYLANAATEIVSLRQTRRQPAAKVTSKSAGTTISNTQQRAHIHCHIDGINNRRFRAKDTPPGCTCFVIVTPRGCNLPKPSITDVLELMTPRGCNLRNHQ